VKITPKKRSTNARLEAVFNQQGPCTSRPISAFHESKKNAYFPNCGTYNHEKNSNKNKV
jgi:hypothetical protein